MPFSAKTFIVGFVVVLAMRGSAVADDALPTTRPSESTQLAEKPAQQKEAAIRRAFRDLAAPSPSARDEARDWLLTLDNADLKTLRQVVKTNQPVFPGQVPALREVVTHLYLRGDAYVPDLEHGFLGVKFDLDQDANEPETGGVEIRHRAPGFSAYRYLRDGDVICAIVGPPRLEIHLSMRMSEAVQAFRAGQTIVFEVLRDGQLLTVPVVLDAYPQIFSPGQPRPVGQTDDFLGRRQNDADKYWEENFEPLVTREIS